MIGGKTGYFNILTSVWVGRMQWGIKWSKGPNLRLSRTGHRSIVIGNQIYHIGGIENM